MCALARNPPAGFRLAEGRAGGAGDRCRRTDRHRRGSRSRPPWIRAVMPAESLNDVLTLSPKGAMDLMQIMPDMWSELRARYRLGADRYDPHDNIIAGAAYLRELHDCYSERGFLAAYNSGPSRYEEHLATGRPLSSETLFLHGGSRFADRRSHSGRRKRCRVHGALMNLCVSIRSSSGNWLHANSTIIQCADIATSG